MELPTIVGTDMAFPFEEPKSRPHLPWLLFAMASICGITAAAIGGGVVDALAVAAFLFILAAMIVGALNAGRTP